MTHKIYIKQEGGDFRQQLQIQNLVLLKPLFQEMFTIIDISFDR
jgi:hypothetical protein